jgi:hypothetical protein
MILAQGRSAHPHHPALATSDTAQLQVLSWHSSWKQQPADRLPWLLLVPSAPAAAGRLLLQKVLLSSAAAYAAVPDGSDNAFLLFLLLLLLSVAAEKATPSAAEAD